MYKAFHPKEANYTFFSNVQGTFSKTEHMIGHKISLNKLRKIVIISSIFVGHNGMKLEICLSEKYFKIIQIHRD